MEDLFTVTELSKKKRKKKKGGKKRKGGRRKKVHSWSGRALISAVEKEYDLGRGPVVLESTNTPPRPAPTLAHLPYFSE